MISAEYTTLLKQLLVNGYSTVTVYSSGSYGTSATSVTFQLPTSVQVVVLDNGSAVATALAKVTSVTESGGTLSITFLATFNTSFNGDQLRLYATVGTTLVYLIAYADVNVTSSQQDPLSVEWTITVTTSGDFGVEVTPTQTTSSQQSVITFALSPTLCCNLNGTVYAYPYLVHLIIAYTLIPSPSYVIQTQFPNIPLAVMLQAIPQPVNAMQFYGVTAVAVTCSINGQDTPVYCGNATDGVGNIIFLYTPNNCGGGVPPGGGSQPTPATTCQSPTALALYQLGTAYLTLLQAQLYTVPNTGSAISISVVIEVT